jgi:hypothetical protein
MACIWSLWDAHGFANDTTVPNLIDWIKEVEAKPQSEKTPFLRSIIFVEGVDKHGIPQFKDFDEKYFNAQSAIRIVPRRTSQLIYKLNQVPTFKVHYTDQPLSETANTSKLTTQDHDLLLVSEVDALVRIQAHEQGARWNLIYLNENKKLESIYSTPPQQQDSHGAGIWLKSILGYDGHVLAQKENYVLVVSVHGPIPTGIQGLVVEGAAERPLLRTKNHQHKAQALLEHVQTDGIYTIFRVLLGQSNKAEIGYGSKVLLESSQALKP